MQQALSNLWLKKISVYGLRGEYLFLSDFKVMSQGSDQFLWFSYSILTLLEIIDKYLFSFDYV